MSGAESWVRPATRDFRASQKQRHAARPAPELERNKPIEREIAGKQVHRYTVKMTASQYAHVLVIPKGTNIEVSLFKPGGELLMRLDGGGYQVPERVHWIADVSGAYRLEVRDQGSRSGPRYRIELLDHGPATERARALTSAAQMAAEGDRAFEEETEAGNKAAIKKYEEALTAYRALADKERETAMLYNLGFVYRAMGDMPNALARYSEALRLQEAGGSPGEVASTLNDLGSVHTQMGDPQTALGFYERALPLRVAAGDEYGEAITLNDIGLVYRNLGELQKAIEYYDRALPIRRALGDKHGEAVTLHNIGAIHHNLGEWEAAIDHFVRAAAALEQVKDTHGQATSLNRLGDVHKALGDLPRALNIYEKALQLRRVVGDKRGEAISLDSLGTVHRELRDFQKSMQYYEQALPLRRLVRDRRGEAATLNNIGNLQRLLNNVPRALEHYNQALVLSRETLDRWGEARALQNIAHIDRDQGRLDDARVRIEHAISLIELIRSGTGTSEGRYSFLSTVYDYYEFYIDLLMRMHAANPDAGHDLAAFSVSEQARARGLLELLAESPGGAPSGGEPQLVERKRSIDKRITERLDELARLQVAGTANVSGPAFDEVIARLKRERREVQAQMRENDPRYSALAEPEQLDIREVQRNLLDRDTVLLQYSLGDAASYLWLVTPERVSSFRLPPRDEIEQPARRLHQLLAGGSPADERSPARKTSSADRYKTHARTLSRQLLGGVYEEIRGKRLVIVADGALQYVPFAALPVPNAIPGADGDGDARTVAADHEVVSLPSVSVLSVLRRQTVDRRRPEGAIAVLADPVFAPDDARVTRGFAAKTRGRVGQSRGLRPPRTLERSLSGMRGGRGTSNLRRLLFSRDEAESILAVASGGSVLKALDFRANRQQVMADELGKYRIVHFATHGLLNSRNPELSGLVLSLVDEAGRPQEGFLRLHEIYNLRLKADLVVLSACQTGLGREVRGEGLIGLTRGFMHAGAPRVVASLWQVDDAATAALMKHFYQGLLERNLSPAAALRAAQIEISKKRAWRSPYYWGAFVLQGDWK